MKLLEFQYVQPSEKVLKTFGIYLVVSVVLQRKMLLNGTSAISAMCVEVNKS